MLKACLKNYLCNLKYLFVALGIMLIALVFGTQNFVGKSAEHINTMTSSISETTKNADLSMNVIGDSLADTAAGFLNKLGIGTDEDVQRSDRDKMSLGAAIGVVLNNYTKYIGEVAGDVALAFVGILIAFGVFILIQIIGLLVGDLAVTIFGRYDLASDNIFRVLGEQLVRIGFIIVWIALTIGMTVISIFSGAAFLIAYPLAFCYIVLFTTWLLAKKEGRPAYSEFVTFRNMLVLLAANIIQLLMSVVIGVAVYFILGGASAVVCGLALAVFTSANANINAYVAMYGLPGYAFNAAGTGAGSADTGGMIENSGAVAGSAAGAESAGASGTGAESADAVNADAASADAESAGAAGAVAVGAASGAAAEAIAADTAAADTAAAEKIAAEKAAAEKIAAEKTAAEKAEANKAAADKAAKKAAAMKAAAEKAVKEAAAETAAAEKAAAENAVAASAAAGAAAGSVTGAAGTDPGTENPDDTMYIRFPEEEEFNNADSGRDTGIRLN